LDDTLKSLFEIDWGLRCAVRAWYFVGIQLAIPLNASDEKKSFLSLVALLWPLCLHQQFSPSPST
jgi:hypothetical protein